MINACSINSKNIKDSLVTLHILVTLYILVMSHTLVTLHIQVTSQFLVTSHIYLVRTQVKVLRPFGQKVEGGLELEAVPEQVDPGKDVETWKILIVNNSKILRGNLWYVKKK
jgi:hypothetical protein